MPCNTYIFDPKVWSVRFDGPKIDTNGVKFIDDWGHVTGADLCFNLGIFVMKTGVSCTYVKSHKGIHSYGLEGKSRLLDLDGINACCGYSNGITDNMVLVNHPMGGSSYRNGIGITTTGEVIIAQTSTKTTEKTFCQKVLSDCVKRGYRVKTFILEDGGGSTSMRSNLSNLNFYPAGKRKVATITCVSRKYPIALKRYSPKKDDNGLPIERNLALGCSGEDVRMLQMVLGGIECDGLYGTGTYKRVKEAQKALGIKIDGKCGPQTKKALGFV